MNHRILIVEDEARLREILCDYFRSKGEIPFEADNGPGREPVLGLPLQRIL